jgi:fumarate hydratase class II
MSQEPEQELWGPQTEAARRALGEISGQPFPVEVIHALALIKAESARLRGREDIAAAADAVAAGEHDRHFPLDVFQTGSGTSSNMNVNEVVAQLVGPGTHPNDDVNAPLSSNDQVPSAPCTSRSSPTCSAASSPPGRAWPRCCSAGPWSGTTS